MQVPADLARHIDPKNPLQMLLMQRVDKLQPPELQALAQMPPAAAQALKKIIPELGMLIDKYILNQGGDQGQPGAMPQADGGAGGMQRPAPPAATMPGGGAGMSRPGNRLGSM
jgi:hypothetical protein